MKQSKGVIILCEDGWRHTRELSIELGLAGLPVKVLVKGYPGRDVTTFITSRLNVENYFFPRVVFRVLLPFVLLFLIFQQRYAYCIWMQPRTVAMLRPFCVLFDIAPIRLIEDGNNRALENAFGSRITADDLIEAVCIK